ncbi:serine/threonine-protein kinase [Actinocorallia longicatena]
MERLDVAEGWAVPGFALVRELGTDGSGRQVLAMDEMTKTQVTIRYLSAAVSRDDAFQQRITWLSQLEDDNLVQVYELIENGGEAAIVAEYFDGVPLRRLLGDPLDAESAVVVLSDVLFGLAAAHAKGIIHGDITPDRVQIAPDGRAKLADFCLAVPGGKGAPAGNPAYQAPERWQGSPQSAQADIYAATAVFVECLTGRPVFSGSANAIGKAHANSPIPVGDIPGPLRPLVLRGLAKEADKRPGGAADFLTELDEAVSPVFGADWEKRSRARVRELAHRAATAPAPTSSTPRAKVVSSAPASASSSRRPLMLAAGGLVAVGVVAAAVYGAKNKDAEAGPSPTMAITTAPVPPATGDPTTTPSPVTPVAELTGPDLADKISSAAAAKGYATISFRLISGRNVTTASGGVKIKGTDLKVNLTGPKPYLKRPAFVVGDYAYVQQGLKWQKLPLGAKAKGYGVLATQTRWGVSLDALTALLGASETFDRKGSRFIGTVPTPSGLSAIAPGYKKPKVGYELVMGSGSLPKQLKITITAAGKPRISLTTVYGGWGAKQTIKAPTK